MSSFVDTSHPVRPGEQLPEGQLEVYLAQQGFAGPIEISQFPKGHSNLTYLVRAGDRSFVLRRPPFGSKVKTAHDMAREFRVLSALWPVFPCPKPVLFCDDESVIGVKFYMMERLYGIVLRKDLPAGLEVDLRVLHHNLIAQLASLHAVDVQRVGLSDFGKPEGYVARQVSGWAKRYADAETDVVDDIAFVARWLAHNQPKEAAFALIHNDFKLDNVVLDPSDPTRIVGVLDWEMATLGCPLMDLGTTLAYWVQADDPDPMHLVRWGPTAGSGALTREDLVHLYSRLSGREVNNPTFYYVFGLFKTAVVLQQIYYRYVHGFTKDERFAALGRAVSVLAAAARRAIERGRV